jgi:hypothetical protein
MSRPSDPRLDNVETLPIRHVKDIPAKAPEALWLIDSLWANSGVGVVGGLPKSLKTWLATELALAVAAGTKALGRFDVKAQGPVLVFAAEDDPPAMRARFQSVAQARGVRLEDLPVFLIDVSALYLDDRQHLLRLRRTIYSLQPRLLILDPFVRIVRLDENSSQEVSQVLGSLRSLQRDYDLAVILVHHFRKSPSINMGQQLRGSGDFAAWYDSALYLLQQGEHLILHAEHRGAPAPPPFRVRLAEGDMPHLVVEDLPAATGFSGDAQNGENASLQEAVLAHLEMTRRPLTTPELRDALKVRKASLLEALRRLVSARQITRSADGWAPLPPVSP